MSAEIRLESVDGIATVIIDQQEKRNALSRAMWRQIGEIFSGLADDGDIRCVILRGAGELSFCAGADISEFEQNRNSASASSAYDLLVRPSLRAVVECPHPVVAQIHGLCIGGGLELAACADIRICGTSSRFAVPSARLGLVLSYQDLDRVLSLVGPANLKEILFEMQMMDAEQALRIGLVNRVVADDAVAAEASATAARIAAGAPLTHRWHKKAIDRIAHNNFLDGLTESDIEESHAIFNSEDFREGYRSFMEKRKPRFKGR